MFVNSLGTTMAMWDPQVAGIGGRCRVLRYDQRGHGGSSSPPGPYTITALGEDLVGLLDALEVEEAAICGLSIGGAAALWVAAHHPGRVRSLVLAATAPVLGTPGAWHERAQAVRREGTASLAEHLTERWFPREVRDARPALVAGVHAMLASCDDEGYAACCAALATMDLRIELTSVRAPSLVLAGAEDPVTPPDVELELAQALGARLVVLPGASHLVNQAAPEAFTAALCDHTLGTPAARGDAVRRAVLGDAHVERAGSDPDPLARAFSDYVTRAAWGEVWSRPGLERRVRSAVALAILVALGHHDELELHVAAARRNGLSPDEIGEIVLQCGLYAGLPAARSALPSVRRALAATAARPSGDRPGGPEAPGGP